MDLISQALKPLGRVPSWVWIGAAVGVALYVAKKGMAGAAQSVSAGAVGAVADIALGATSGAVLGIGDALGVPRTSETACEKAMREGDNWGASFACPASTYLAWQGRGVKKSLFDLFN